MTSCGTVGEMSCQEVDGRVVDDLLDTQLPADLVLNRDAQIHHCHAVDAESAELNILGAWREGGSLVGRRNELHRLEHIQKHGFRRLAIHQNTSISMEL